MFALSERRRARLLRCRCFLGMGGWVAVLQAKRGRWKESWNALWLEDCSILVSISWGDIGEIRTLMVASIPAWKAICL